MFDYERVDPEQHVSSLETFLQVAPHLQLHETWLDKPVLRHPDLSMNNILIDDELKISGIIDWQHASVLPLFLCAGVPKAFINDRTPLDDTSEQSSRFRTPKYDETRNETKTSYPLTVHQRYINTTKTKPNLQSHYGAIEHKEAIYVQRSWKSSIAPWEGNSIPLQADLIQLAKVWPRMVGKDSRGDAKPMPCPIHSKRWRQRT